MQFLYLMLFVLIAACSGESNVFTLESKGGNNSAEAGIQSGGHTPTPENKELSNSESCKTIEFSAKPPTLYSSTNKRKFEELNCKDIARHCQVKSDCVIGGGGGCFQDDVYHAEYIAVMSRYSVISSHAKDCNLPKKILSADIDCKENRCTMENIKHGP